MNASLLVFFGLWVLPMLQNRTEPSYEPPPKVTDQIARLPECSLLRKELEQGKSADGVERPYMRPMLDQGVQRAFFEFQGTWRHERAENIRIVRRLYFKKLEGPNAQITEEAALKEIQNSGVEAILDEAVLARGKNAHLFAGVDQWAGVGVIGYWGWLLKGSRISGSIELFASELLSPVTRDLVSPYKLRHDIAHASSNCDVVDLSKLLSMKKYSQPELNRALRFAVGSPRDNTGAIFMLIRVGADVNAKLDDGTTPLMLVRSSCNIPVLLAHGARVEDRDKSGRTASDLARQRHDAVAIRMLESTARQ